MQLSCSKCNSRKNPALGDWLTTAISVGSSLFNRPDQYKAQGQCSISMNSGDIKTINKNNLPGLPLYRSSVKDKIYNKVRPRTWGECARARLSLPSQILGPLGQPDMVDFISDYPDPIGAIYAQNVNSDSLIVNDKIIIPETGQVIDVIKVNNPSVVDAVIKNINMNYVFISAVALIIFMANKK